MSPSDTSATGGVGGLNPLAFQRGAEEGGTVQYLLSFFAISPPKSGAIKHI